VKGFVRRRSGYVAHLDATERAILGRVVADTAALLGQRLELEDDADDGDPLAGLGWSESGIEEPDDPAVARLLPSASRDDDEISVEFRRLTEADLRMAKTDRLRLVWAGLRTPGEKLVVAPDAAMDWAAALTDVRLVIAERLGVSTDADAEAVYALAGAGSSGDDEVRAALASLYAALTWLQESLLSVMTRDI
jgi:hypothetical protein